MKCNKDLLLIFDCNWWIESQVQICLSSATLVSNQVRPARVLGGEATRLGQHHSTKLHIDLASICHILLKAIIQFTSLLA